ncbi:MAG: sulfatase-like hydrolase/transferase, partial [Candidatus Paceibacteria bacterium]
HQTETRSDALSEGVPYAPEILSKNGFKTLGVSAMGNISSTLGFNRGFDEFIDLYKDQNLPAERSVTTPDVEKIPDEEERILYPRAEDISEKITHWIEEYDDDQDLFIFAWAIDPHDPYDPKPGAEYFLEPEYGVSEELGRNRDTINEVSSDEGFKKLIDLYDSEIRYMDEEIGKIISKLKENNMFDDSIFVFTGDHGESFGERKWAGDYVRAHNTPPFDERLKVPLLFKTPSENEIKRDGFIESIDIFPSILDILDIRHNMQGGSIFTKTKKRYTYSKTQQEDNYAIFYSCRDKKRKYIYFEKPELKINNIISSPLHFLRHYLIKNEFIYDLEKDSMEIQRITNIPDEYQLKKNLNAHIHNSNSIGQKFEKKKSDADDALEEQLRALGYQ